MKKILTLCVVSGLLLVAMIAVARSAVDFDLSVEIAGQSTPLRGTGTLTWGLFFAVYEGALYLPSEVSAGEVLDLVPKQLEIHYFTTIEAHQFAESAEPVLQRNLSPELLAEARPGIEKINRLYRDVQKGDRYSLTYIPNVGTQLALNGETLGVISGEAFARAYFAIWLGEKPLDKDFKEQLLDLRG